MPSDKAFRIKTAPARKKKFGIGGILRKKQFVLTIVGVYVIIGGLLGYMLFNSNSELAKASEAASVSTSIRLINNEELKIGDEVRVSVTIQNTSITESINSINISFLSTKNAISWKTVETGISNQTGETIQGINNSFKLPILSSGERTEFVASGTLESNEIEYLTILGNITFINKLGSQDVTTNRVFTKLSKSEIANNDLYSLNVSKLAYNPGEEIQFVLSNFSEGSILNGDIYISKKDGSLVDSYTCSIDDKGQCVATISNLESGEYSALYKDPSFSKYSTISKFTVTGQGADDVVSAQSQISLPFGNRSINGIIPVYAERVISPNDQVQNGSMCVFQVSQLDQIVLESRSAIKDDRTCNTTISRAELGNRDGIYTISLKGSNEQKTISVLPLPIAYIPLTTPQTFLTQGQNLLLETNNVRDINNELVNGIQGKLFILHTNSGNIQEVSFLNGKQIVVNNGSWQGIVQPELLAQDGSYSFFLQLEDSQISEFLRLSHTNQRAGVIDSGIIIDDYSNLQVGKTPLFSLTGIEDRNGDSLDSGSCTLTIQQRSTLPQVIDGAIQNGVCRVQAKSDSLIKHGSALIEISINNQSTSVVQSKHVHIHPGIISSYGEINFEFEPLRTQFANTIFIGPIIDANGNHTAIYSHNLEVSSDNKIIWSAPIEGRSGFGKIIIPASVMNNKDLKFSLIDQSGNEVLSKNVQTTKNNDNLFLPNFKESYSNDLPIKVGYSSEYIGEQFECQLAFVSNNSPESTVSQLFDPLSQTCEFDWDAQLGRSERLALMRFTTPDGNYHSLVENTPGKPSNVFRTTYQLKKNIQNKVEVALLTSPIVDRVGREIKNSDIEFQFNGNSRSTPIRNGVGILYVTKDEINDDITQDGNQSYLNLSVRGRSGIISNSSESTSFIYIGDSQISSPLITFSQLNTQNIIESERPQLMSFKSETCNVIESSQSQNSKIATTHKENDTCYVEVNNVPGSYKLLFVKDGFEIGSYEYEISNEVMDVIWCNSNPCIVQTLGQLKSSVEASIIDDENIYSYKSDVLGTTIELKQNGLNPLKNYPVVIKFTDINGRNFETQRMISGSMLTE